MYEPKSNIFYINISRHGAENAGTDNVEKIKDAALVEASDITGELRDLRSRLLILAEAFDNLGMEKKAKDAREVGHVLDMAQLLVLDTDLDGSFTAFEAWKSDNE